MRLGYDPSVRRLTEKDGEFSINSEKEKKRKKKKMWGVGERRVVRKGWGKKRKWERNMNESENI